eukprot:scaffold20340_cov18-Tisochrysis_lutea.AAC.2
MCAESPAVVDAWTKSVTRVLVINRHMFQELSKAFPQEVDTILKNLRNRCEGVRWLRRMCVYVKEVCAGDEQEGLGLTSTDMSACPLCTKFLLLRARHEHI